MGQQEQTKQYFDANAAGWQTKAAEAKHVYNVIEGRHRAVLAVREDLPNVGRVLDIGCGTGQLLLSIAAPGIVVEGIDFAPGMIQQCETNAHAVGAEARFTCASIFDVPLEENAYDLISAQGLIEYLSLDETDELLVRCMRALRPGGALALGSRNRLFNALSLNAFTRTEMELGTVSALIAESVLLHTSDSMEAAFKALRRVERIDPHPDRHPDTGIHVDTRYQFTPAELAYRMRRAGLEPTAIFPVNFHAVPPAVGAENPLLLAQMAQHASEAWLRDHRLVPYSSSFVMRGDKAGA